MYRRYLSSITPNRLSYRNVSTMQTTTWLLCLALGIAASSLLPLSVRAQNAYVQHNLVSDLAGLADNTDTNLANPWGIAFSARGPFWIADNHTGFSTIYNTSGGIQALVVNIPPPSSGQPPGAPTGLIFNSTTNFSVAADTPSRFILSLKTEPWWPGALGRTRS